MADGSNGSKTNALQLWIDAIEPSHAFAAELAPAAPDYADPANWAARPSAMGAAGFTPAGVEAADPAEAAADVFYVHPTTYIGAGNWNADLSGAPAETRASEIVDHLMMPEHAGLFNGCCRIYAPRYRQATLAVFYRPGPEGRQALELAYSDVVRAFKHYIAHDNGGRPFILASHSQGTEQLMRLLAEDFDPALKDRLIAAYLLGFKITAEKAKTFAHIVTPAVDATGTGVFIGYDCFLEGTEPLKHPDDVEHWLPSGWTSRHGKAVHGINPVNWSTSAPSAAVDHLGMAWVTLADPSLIAKLYMAGPDAGLGLKALALEAPIKPAVAACVDAGGFLKISKPEQEIFNRGIYGGVYHIRDISLFYMDLRKNVEDRVRAFLAKG